ncbi:MAG: hypothetical protein FWG73_01725 [Planctomycetaceae bacterium]|nr:hypothetical protein [Planctomycetaceae bacterium]
MSLFGVLVRADVPSGENAVVNADDVLATIRIFEEVNQRPLTLDEGFALLRGIREHVTAEEHWGLIQEISSQQKNPPVSLESLIRLFTSKRDSIRDFVCKYRLLDQRFDDNGAGASETVIAYEYGFKGSKMLIERNVLSPSNSEGVRRLSYDGEVFIDLREVASMPMQAGIMPAEDRGIFVQGNLPILTSGLFDVRSWDVPLPFDDLVFFLEGDFFGGRQPPIPATIFESIEMVNGNRCVVAATMQAKSVFLSLEHDYSIVQSNRYGTFFKVKHGQRVPAGIYLTMRETMHGLKDYGNGIWLPDEVVREFYAENGNIVRRQTVNVLLYSINNNLEDSYFTNFIPEGVIVSDTVRGMVYEWSDHPSINALIKKTAKSKRTWFLQYLSLTVGCILILLVVVVKYIKYLKQKQTA